MRSIKQGETNSNKLFPDFFISFCKRTFNRKPPKPSNNPNRALRSALQTQYLACLKWSLKKRVNLGRTGELVEGVLDCIHEIKDAITSKMTVDSGYRVETTSRLAQWKLGNLSPYTYRKSDPFKIGHWNWHLGVERSKALFVKLFPQVSSFTRENPPIATFVIRLLCSSGDRKPLHHPEVSEKQLKKSDDFIWTIDLPLSGSFIVEVEFVDLKIALPDGGEARSIWVHTDALFLRGNSGSTLTRMLTESILTDVVIHVSERGSIRAHRAVLAARSPFFREMFSDDKQLTSLEICDMSLDECKALVWFLYGSIERDEFLRHRVALLGAANRYEIADLKEACHVSLIEDIDSGNVLERLKSSWMYELEGLKSACLRYLLKFGKVCDVKEVFGEFVRDADKELVAEIFMEILSAWKAF